jgi:hypothetical protein
MCTKARKGIWRNVLINCVEKKNKINTLMKVKWSARKEEKQEH